MARLIVDASVLITTERRGKRTRFAEDDDVALAAVTAAELLTGVALADDAHRESRRRAVDALLDVMPVEIYDLRVARVHADLLAHVRRTGRPRGAHDLIVAATAVATKRRGMTRDASGFVDLPGVELADGSS